MKMCMPHWEMCREAVTDRGMYGLVLKSGKAAVDNIVEELQGGEPAFDPLMSLNNHFWGEALRCGGLYLMGQNETGENGGHYCPICELEKNSRAYIAKEAIGSIADQMRDHAIKQKMIPEAS